MYCRYSICGLQKVEFKCLLLLGKQLKYGRVQMFGAALFVLDRAVSYVKEIERWT